MTCIIGLVYGDNVYIGGDSAAVAGFEVRRTKQPKVFRLGEMAIGYTTSFRMGQLLQYNVCMEQPADGQDLMEYMVHDFVELVRNCFKEHGFTKVENNQESSGTFLVGFRGRLFSIEDEFQVCENNDGIEAIGCGRQYALGAIRMTGGYAIPEAKIRNAVDVAAY